MRHLLFCLLLLFMPAGALAAVVVDLNSATEERLLDLQTGVSDELIHSIFAYRDKHGPFQNPEDLRQVPGMDDESFEQLFPFRLKGSIVIEVDEPKGISPY
ncbi:MAG TPA: helix-hairpin-helix domain-containing protein [Candidatus Mailhella merdavium]|nr:helix-hairpin-helix domain-containing protein [Candidatus Mailhella merdavium]